MNRNKYKWDGDSRDERESEFASSSFATPTLSGVVHSTWAQERVLRQRRVRLVRVLWPLVAAASLSLLVLCVMVLQLRP